MKAFAPPETFASHIIRYRPLVLLLLFLFLGFASDLQAQFNFAANLNPGGVTSAGIFDSQGHLVRTLWAMEVFPAGNLNASWDGLNDFGSPVPAG